MSDRITDNQPKENSSGLIRKSVWFEPELLEEIRKAAQPEESLSLTVRRLVVASINETDNNDTREGVRESGSEALQSED